MEKEFCVSKTLSHTNKRLKASDKNVIGIEHHANTCEDGIGSEEGHQALMDFTLSENAGQDADVHWDGAELPGEDVPLEVPQQLVIFNVEAVNEHFEDFQQNDDHTRDKDGAADAGVMAFFMGDAQKNARKDGQCEEHEVEPAVIGGALHGCFADLL